MSANCVVRCGRYSKNSNCISVSLLEATIAPVVEGGWGAVAVAAAPLPCSFLTWVWTSWGVWPEDSAGSNEASRDSLTSVSSFEG